ncbi:MAG: hypothetical protein V1926_03035 [Candidatus Peregrinibacteria bacterium]
MSPSLARLYRATRVPAVIALITKPVRALAGPSSIANGFSGGGIRNGVNAAANALGVSGGGNDLKTVIGTIVNTILSYVTLLAVTVIIIAGLYLIVGFGSDASKDTAKKVVLYTTIGIIIILLSKAFVELIKTLI